VTTSLLVLVGEVGLGGGDEGSEGLLVLGTHVLKGDDGGGLLVNDRTETSLVLDNDVWDTHLPAESREEDDQLDRVDIVGDDDQGSLLGLDESDTVVETVLGEEGLLRVLGGGLVTLGGLGLGLLEETSLLLLLGLRLVLVQELEELGGGVLVKGVTELGDGGWDLQPLVEDDLLPLKPDVLGPPDEAGEVLLDWDVTADSEALALLLEERVLRSLLGLAASGVYTLSNHQQSDWIECRTDKGASGSGTALTWRRSGP